jgi:hypothetical protein
MLKRRTICITLVCIISTLLITGCKSKTNDEIVLEYNNYTTNNKVSNSVKSLDNVSLGVSDDNTVNGLNEALSSIKADSNLIVAYYSPELKGEEVYNKIKSKYPNATVYGESSNNEILSSKGTVKGIAILGVKESDKSAGASGVTLKDKSNLDTQIKDVLKQCQERAGVSSDTKPKAIYVAIKNGLEEYVDKSIQEVYGKDVPIYGGTPADNGKDTGKWSSISSSGSADGVSILCYYDNVGTSYKSGFISSSDASKTGKITGISDDRTITTIDNKNALEVINDWTNNAFSKSGTVSTDNQFNLLAKEQSGEVVTMAVNSASEKGVNLFANVSIGDTIKYIPATIEPLIHRAEPLVRDALLKGNLRKTDIDYSLVVLCAGARAKIGDRLPEYTDLLNTSLSNSPWIGVIAYGEEGFVQGQGSFHGNFMNSILVRKINK